MNELSAKELLGRLSRRERQALEAIHRLEQATITDLAEEITDAPSRPAIRSMLVSMEEKGVVCRTRVGREYLYRSVLPRDLVALSLFQNLLNTFYEGSLTEAVTSLVTHPAKRPDGRELRRLNRLLTHELRTPREI